MCKDNSVHAVKEITSQQVQEYTCHRVDITTDYAINTKKALDRSLRWYIIIFTNRDRHSEDLVNARQGGQKVQARRPQAARHAESASERGDRPPGRNWRFLRSRRCRTGQVRDASPRHCRRTISHAVRSGIRLLTSYLLSSGSGLSARWTLRAIAREARATARPQTHAGGSGLRYTTPWMSIHSEPFLDGSSQVQRAQRRIACPELYSEVQNLRREFVASPWPSLLGQ